MPRGASSKREREYNALKKTFKRERRYPGREEEVAARIINKQRAQFGETQPARAEDKRGESPDQHWETYLDHAYHAADIAVYHGTWMGRLECTAAFSAPLPKFRFTGLLAAYLETGDPYLLEISRSLAGAPAARCWWKNRWRERLSSAGKRPGTHL